MSWDDLSLTPAKLARGEFHVTSTSFAVAEQVLEHVITHRNRLIAFGVHPTERTAVVAGEDVRPAHPTRLVYHGTRERPTRHYYGLEDAGGVEIALLAIDEVDVQEVHASATDTWSFWSVWITLVGGTRLAIGRVEQVG